MHKNPETFLLLHHFNKRKVMQLCDAPTYYIQTIRKRTKGHRKLTIPEYPLDEVQKALMPYLNNVYDKNFWPVELSKRRMSVVTHAKHHVMNKFIFKTDIHNFYPSISAIDLRDELTSARFGISRAMANFIVSICTYKGYLTQGSSTSPVLSNMYFLRADKILQEYARLYKMTYSRYADDIVLSSNTYIDYQKVREDVTEILQKFNLRINTHKTHAVSANRKQTICNLTVNEKVNVDRRYIRKIRAILHHWEKDGMDAASEKHFGIEKVAERFRARNYFYTKLMGMINWVGSVRGKDDDIYLKLWNKFLILKAKVVMYSPIDETHRFTKSDTLKLINKTKGKYFDDFDGGFNMTCLHCTATTEFENTIRFRLKAMGDTISTLDFHYQFQCQECGELSYPSQSKVSEDLFTVDEKCACGGELRRDKYLFCKECKTQREK